MALDHIEEFFPENVNGNKICTLDTSTDPKDVWYRYGIFGDFRFIDKLPVLPSKSDYKEIIRDLYNKIDEIETWMGERDEKTDKEHQKRIQKILDFIDKMEIIINKM